MDKDNISAWIINWFKDNTFLKEEEIRSQIDVNYFEKGWIDSFKFISFVTDVEENFGIHFSNNEFQDRAFATIEGVARIIESKLNEQI